MRDDIFFMNQAYLQARKAFKRQEVPIGAVLVDDSGKIIARGYNQVEHKQTQLAHAEMLVLAKASKKLQAWRFEKLTLYVTLQPCLMCTGALYLSRIFRVVYGVVSTKYGVSYQQLHDVGIYKNLQTQLQCIDYEPSKKLLKMFFQKKRSKQYDQQVRVGKD